MGAVKQMMLEDQGVNLDGENDDVREMVEWFLARYEDPVHHCPYVDGEYVFGAAGPIDASEIISTTFGDKKDDADIERAFELLEAECTEWDPIPGGPADPEKDESNEEPDEEDDFPDDEEGDYDPDSEED